MAARDTAFLLAFLAAVGAFIMFCLVFVKPWTERDHGQVGLWSDCTVNRSLESEDQFDCFSTAKADGPAFLEVVRTLFILALVCEIMGVIGYNIFQPKPNDLKMKKAFKERIQEIAYFLAGLFTMTGAVIYGLYSYDYYTETKDYTGVRLMWIFYLGSVAGVLTFLCSIVILCTRHTDGMRKTDKARKVEKSRKNLEDATVKSKDPKGGKEADEDTNDNDVNDEVAVKASSLKRIATPTHIMLAFNRIKSDLGNKKKRKDLDREGSGLGDGNHHTQPPPSDIKLFTPTPRTVKWFDERSLSLSSFSSSEEDNQIDNKSNKEYERQKIKRSVTTLKDNPISKPWAVEFTNEDDSAKTNSSLRRHVSHGAIKHPHQTTQPPNSVPTISEKGSYTFPTEGQNHDALTVPRYEEVIGSGGHGEVPQPMITDQSRIFQPYTKQ